LAFLLAGCGATKRPPASSAAAPSTAPAPAAPPPAGPALGLTEGNAALLWNPADPAAPDPAAFGVARSRLSALHPAYVRLLVNWAALQPDPQHPAALEAPASGCARETGPCAAYDGIAGELRAIASQQRAGGGFAIVIDILGAPAWAALPAHGCERPEDGSFARPLQPAALASYRALIAGLIALARREGVEVAWWSPWNEPNDPRFLTPQRASCDATGAPLAPGVYARLAAAMSAELSAQHSRSQILLGELGGYDSGSAHRLSVGEFVAALPAATLCTGSAWSVHAYAARAPRPPGPDPVELLEAALRARAGCAAHAPIWVTETGAGAPEPGQRATGARGEEQAACLALARRVLGWYANPRVRVVLQYSFRDDPAFPVGLLSADLRRPHPTYSMWLALARARASRVVPPPPERACA
jgi:hypothetical protein